MADVGVNTAYMLDLKKDLSYLVSTCQTLDNLFVDGAFRLARDADVQKLQGLAIGLKHQLEEVTLREGRAKTSWERAMAIGDVGKLVDGVFGSNPGEHPGVETFKTTLAARLAGRRQYFGTVMVCVGSAGLPDDIHLISISELARKQRRKEDEIIRELQQKGKRLFTPNNFLDMLEKYVEKAREGKLCLPVATGQLPAGLAVPRRITIEYVGQFRPVQSLPPGSSWVQKKNGNLPDSTT